MTHPALSSPKFWLFALVATFLAVAPASSAPVRVGIAASVAGDVRLNNASLKKAVKIARRQRLAWGDTLTTKKKSKVQILLLDRSSLTVGSNSRLTINRFVYDPTKSRSVGASVSKGAFRFMSGRRTANSSAKVDTPTGSIGIRGTVLDGIVGKEAVKIAKDEPALDGIKSDKKTASLIVLRGPGAGTEGGLDVGLADVTAAGVTVTLDQPALAAYIPREGAPPIGPFRLSQPGLSALQDELAPRVANAGGGGLLGKLLPALAGVAIGAILLTDGDEDDNPNNGTVTQPTPQCTPGTNNNNC